MTHYRALQSFSNPGVLIVYNRLCTSRSILFSEPPNFGVLWHVRSIRPPIYGTAFTFSQGHKYLAI